MEIQTKQKEIAKKIVKKHGLEFVVVFGSQVNGKARQDSDLDIGVLDSKAESYDRFGKIYNDFSDLFKGYNIDLRMIRGRANQYFYTTP